MSILDRILRRRPRPRDIEPEPEPAPPEDKPKPATADHGGGGRRRFSAAQVQEIRKRNADGGEGSSINALSREFGVAPSSIFDIVHRYSYRDIEDGEESQ